MDPNQLRCWKNTETTRVPWVPCTTTCRSRAVGPAPGWVFLWFPGTGYFPTKHPGVYPLGSPKPAKMVEASTKKNPLFRRLLGWCPKIDRSNINTKSKFLGQVFCIREMGLVVNSRFIFFGVTTTGMQNPLCLSGTQPLLSWQRRKTGWWKCCRPNASPHHNNI